MRPLKLTISAFGPYIDAVYLDLDRFKKNGLYLITGDTGSGKTTIFDAITYSLYGLPSGNIRQPSSLRSTNAKDTTETYVEMEFEYFMSRYIVRRNPQYQRPKQKGEGYTTKHADASLIYPDGRIITGSSNVTEAIKDLLGIDRNQFSQIAMIAQGDFLKLLIASTAERGDIFRQIFKTQPYDQLQSRLKEEYQTLESKRNTIINLRQQYIASISCEEDDELIEMVNNAKEGKLLTSSIIQLLEMLITKDEVRSMKLDATISKINEEISLRDNLIGKTENDLQLNDLLQNAKENLKANKNEIELQRDRYEQAISHKPEIDKYNEEIIREQSNLDKYDRIHELNNQAEDKQKQLEETIVNKEQQEKQLLQLNDWIEDSKKKLLNLSNTETNLIRLETNLIRIDERRKSFEVIKELMDQENTLNKEYLRIGKRYISALEQEEKESENFVKLNKLFFDGQAGILANQLQEGTPCPVCGSLEHPNLAVKSVNIPNESTLKDAEQRLKDAQNTRILIGNENTEILTKRDEKKKEIERKIQDVIGESTEDISDTVETEIKKLMDEREQIVENIKLEENNKTIKLEIEKQTPEYLNIVEELNDSIKINSDRITILTVEIKGIQENIKEQKTILSFDRKDQAEKHIEQISILKTELEKSIETSNNELTETISTVNSLEKTIEELTEKLKDTKILDIDLLREEKKHLVHQRETSFETIKQIDARNKSNKSTKSEVKTNQEEIESLEKQIEWLKVLSQTANGELNQKEKVTLEAFVQARYFDRVIIRANIRLMKMSNAQYELSRADKAGNLMNKSGLELNVIDHYSSSERSVKTLSGGESFMASLSLALGLSDEIQHTSGGIRIDTLFVDEGFGSLDEETLSSAMKVLTGLSENNLLIGIISHVTSLKDRIDRQIVITKDRIGNPKAEIFV